MGGMEDRRLLRPAVALGQNQHPLALSMPVSSSHSPGPLQPANGPRSSRKSALPLLRALFTTPCPGSASPRTQLLSGHRMLQGPSAATLTLIPDMSQCCWLPLLWAPWKHAQKQLKPVTSCCMADFTPSCCTADFTPHTIHPFGNRVIMCQ